MFIFDWFWNILSALGLYKKDAKIAFLGLDSAGKTTLLHMLKDDKISTPYPTQKPDMQELTLGRIKFRTYDLGGNPQARKAWKEYLPDVNAIAYLVDSSDKDRFEESKQEIDALLSSEELANVPIAILANKIDLPGAVSESEFRKIFELEQISSNRPINVFMCSMVNRTGYKEGIQWLSKYL